MLTLIICHALYHAHSPTSQAQDRCHRIGQTREVHIYRLVSENTIEENILRKSDQKRQLDFLAIQSAGFTTDILQGGGGEGVCGIWERYGCCLMTDRRLFHICR